MAFDPIQWAVQTADGRQPGADGAELLNFYAIQPVQPRESKTPVVLYGTPGYESVGDLDTAITMPEQRDTVALTVARVGTESRLLALVRHAHSGGTPALSLIRLALAAAAPGGPVPFRVASPVFDTQAVPRYDSSTPVRLVSRANLALALFDGVLYGFGLDGALRTLPVPQPPGRTGPFVDLAESEGHFILAAKNGALYHTKRDQTAFDAVDYQRMRTHFDLIVGIAVFNRRLYVFGETSIEQWDYDAMSDFAFKRADGYVSDDLGCAAADTIQTNEEGVYFLGSDGIVYTFGAEGFKRLSNEAVAYDITQSDAAQARAFLYTEEEHRFYSLTLTLRNGTKKNWTLDLGTGFWHLRSHTGILAVARTKVATFIGLEGHERLFHYALNYGTEDGQAMTRHAICPVLHANQRRLIAHNFQADLPRLPAVPGVDTDYLELHWSDDQKKTWKPTPATPPATGRSTRQLLTEDVRYRWHRLGQWRQGRNFRLTVVAERRVQLLSAYAHITVNNN